MVLLHGISQVRLRWLRKSKESFELKNKGQPGGRTGCTKFWKLVLPVAGIRSCWARDLNSSATSTSGIIQRGEAWETSTIFQSSLTGASGVPRIPYASRLHWAAPILERTVGIFMSASYFSLKPPIPSETTLEQGSSKQPSKSENPSQKVFCDFGSFFQIKMAASSPDDGLVFVSMNNMLKKIPRKEVSSGRFMTVIFFKKDNAFLCPSMDKNLAWAVPLNLLFSCSDILLQDLPAG